ncbi:hypothetical protein [Methanobrevibacter sp.]|uniref:hypothetical protein n=1 Tax=Methanobrevibacter sp. TaxID=66852 RepID=UPI00386E1828
MNEDVLIEFLDKAKKLGKAVAVDGIGIDYEEIQPGDDYFFKDGCLILDNQVIDCEYISHVELTKTAEQKAAEIEDYFQKLRG